MRKAVGRNVLRKEGREKVTGAARYIDDLSFPDLLHARTIRSTIPAGEITGVAFNFDTTGFTIVDYRDIPGRNIVALIDDDQPCLAERTDSSRRRADPDPRARRSRAPARGGRPHRLPRRRAQLRSGRVAVDVQVDRDRQRRSRRRASPQADHIIEGEYRVGSQEQLYIEPNGVIAVPADDGRGITVYGSMQCPYYVHRALTVLLGFRGDASASSRRKPAAASAARKNIRR